jgi:hyperosmotically inducible periplasmic protein
MTTLSRAIGAGVIGVAMTGLLSGTNGARAQGPAPGTTVESVRRMLERLPYYGVFDFIVFSVDRGTVTLAGYGFHGSLKADAEMAVKRAPGVDTVVNRIVSLPASPNDDRIRWATYYRIYSDDFLSRYGPGEHEVRRELQDERRFPGMQPVGRYPIHIVVQNGRTMLLGVVDNATDRQLVEWRAREVTGVFEVENSLVVSPD